MSIVLISIRDKFPLPSVELIRHPQCKTFALKDHFQLSIFLETFEQFQFFFVFFLSARAGILGHSV